MQIIGVIFIIVGNSFIKHGLDSVEVDVLHCPMLVSDACSKLHFHQAIS